MVYTESIRNILQRIHNFMFVAYNKGCRGGYPSRPAWHVGLGVGGLCRSKPLPRCTANVASLIGRLGSSAFKPSATTFQTIHYCSVDVAHGLALLFGIGTKALPLWDSRTRRNNLLGDLAVRVTAGSSDITNSPHPSSREGHLSTCLLYTSPSPRDR